MHNVQMNRGQLLCFQHRRKFFVEYFNLTTSEYLNVCVIFLVIFGKFTSRQFHNKIYSRKNIQEKCFDVPAADLPTVLASAIHHIQRTASKFNVENFKHR